MKNTQQELIRDSLLDSVELYFNLVQDVEAIKRLADRIVVTLQKGGKLVLCGNGGSAADAQHIATELTGGFRDHKRKPIAALSLTTDTSALTAIANDFGFEKVFSRQVESLVTDKDVLVVLSTSGNSKNVIEAAKAAKKRNALVIGFTGKTGGKLKALCDMCLCVPSTDTPKIQEVHITVGHILAELIEKGMN